MTSLLTRESVNDYDLVVIGSCLADINDKFHLVIILFVQLVVCPVKSLVSIVFCFCIVLHVLLVVTKVPYKSTTLGKLYEFLAYL